MKGRLKRAWWAGLSAVVLAAAAGGCGCDGGSPGATEDPDGSMDAARDAADARTDAADAVVEADADSGPPDASQYDYCDAAFFQLPPTTDDLVMGPVMGGDYISYARYLNFPESETRGDVYLFDLRACTEHLICDAEWTQQPGSIVDSQVYWDDSRYFSGDPSDRRGEIFVFDIETWEETRLTDTPEMKAGPRGNGQYLVFLDTTGAPDGHFGLTLMDLVTSEQKSLAPWEAGAEEYHISERYVVWAASSFDASSYGKDVFYYDLVTEETHHLEESMAFHVYRLSVGGSKIVWEKNDNLYYSIMLHDIETGEDVELTDGSFDCIAPQARGNLTVWETYEYSGGTYSGTPAERDVYLFDLDTGVGRRVTDQSTTWWGRAPDPPWLPIIKGYGPDTMEVFVMNLEKAGLLDSSGHVIPE